jgi:hypothetical protein
MSREASKVGRLPEFFQNAIRIDIIFQWTTIRQDFLILAEDTVICSWISRDELTLKSGDTIIYDRHAQTFIFKKIAGKWKIIYQHDSGIPRIEKQE